MSSEGKEMDVTSQSRSINVMNKKILKMVNDLEEESGFKDVIKELINFELQNMDKDKVTYTKEYEKILNKSLMND